MFDDITADGHRDRIIGELKWLAGTLGGARDLDILIAEVLEPMSQEHSDRPAFADICRDFKGRRARAYESAIAAVTSPRYRALLLDAMEWVECGPWMSNEDPLLRVRREQPVAALAVDELSRRYRNLVKAGKGLRSYNAEERHRLRIRGKKLRYAIEFLAHVFPGKRNSRRREDALTALRDLQDALGRLNDIETRERLATQIAEEDGLPLGAARARAFAAGVIVGKQEAGQEALLEAGERAYAELAAVKSFWT